MKTKDENTEEGTFQLDPTELEQLEMCSSRYYTDPEAEDITESDIQRLINIEEADDIVTRPEAQPLLPDGVAVALRVARIRILGSWLRFLKKHQRGDKLYVFCTSLDHWDSLCGRAGIVLVRKDRVIDCIVTIMN
jgi:hypothetical protein